MKRYICLLAILTAIAALLCGCSLARSDMDASAASRDRLIGVYITTEYIDLFDLEGYIGANASALSGGSIGEADAATIRQGLQLLNIPARQNTFSTPRLPIVGVST